MAVLTTLKQDKAGEWKTLEEYLRELRHRETGATAAITVGGLGCGAAAGFSGALDL